MEEVIGNGWVGDSVFKSLQKGWASLKHSKTYLRLLHAHTKGEIGPLGACGAPEGPYPRGNMVLGGFCGALWGPMALFASRGQPMSLGSLEQVDEADEMQWDGTEASRAELEVGI